MRTRKPIQPDQHYPYRGGRIGTGWFEDTKKEKQDAIKEINEQESICQQHQSRDESW